MGKISTVAEGVGMVTAAKVLPGSLSPELMELH